MENGTLGAYDWLSYEDVRILSSAFAAGLEEIRMSSKKFVVLCGVSSIEWYVSEYASLMAGTVVVPVHASVTAAHLADVLRKCHADTLIVSTHLLHRFKPVIMARRDEGNDDFHLITINDASEAYPAEDVSKSSKIHIDSILWISVMNLGLRLPRFRRIISSPSKGTAEPVMLLPTSGSSGAPKLTIVTSAMLMHQVHVPKQGAPLIMYSFEPLKQSLDVLSKGGSIGVYSGSLAHMLDDCQELRPTVMGATPTFWNSLRSKFQFELNELIAEQKPQTYTLPRSLRRKYFIFIRPKERKKIEKKLVSVWQRRNILGNRCDCPRNIIAFLSTKRCRIAIVGGAATSADLKSWIFSALKCVVVDGALILFRALQT